jgi:hypothetical protein
LNRKLVCQPAARDHLLPALSLRPAFAALRAKTGGAEGIRTPDLLIANQPLYQLSYDPGQFSLFLNNDNYAALPPKDKFFCRPTKSRRVRRSHTIYIAETRRRLLFKGSAPSSHWARET